MIADCSIERKFCFMRKTHTIDYQIILLIFYLVFMNQTLKILLRTIKQIDVFTKPVQLMIKKEEGHKTLFGAFITLGLLFIIFTIFINNLISLFEGANPVIIGYQQQKFEPSLVILNSQNFNFQIGIQNSDYATYIDESIWIMKIKSYSKFFDDESNKEQWTSEDIPMVICSPEAIRQENLREDFSYVDQATNYCIDWDKIEKIPLQGQFVAQHFSYIGVEFFMCSNETKQTNGPECKSREEILSALKHNYLSIQMSTVIPDLSQNKNPFIQQVANFYTTISGKLFKELTFYMQPLTLNTDDGIFLESMKVENALQFLRSTELLDLNDDGDKFLHLTIRLDLVENMTKRTYQKMSAVLSQIGGLWNVLFTLALILQYPISNLSYKLAIINSLFNFEGQQVVSNRKQSLEYFNQQQQDLIPQSNSTGRINRTSTHSDYLKKRLKSILIKNEKIEKIQNISEKENLSKQLVQSVQNFFNTVRRKMRLSFKEYVTFFNYSDQKFKKQQFDFSVRKLEKSLDILYIIKKIHEIDKLKMILLTPAQLKVFDYLPKPTISENPQSSQSRNQYFSILRSHKSNFQKASEAQQAFREIANKLDDPLNKQLIGCMDENIVELLKLQFQGGQNEQQNIQEVGQIDEQDIQENIQLSVNSQRKEDDIENGINSHDGINSNDEINIEIDSGKRQYVYKSIIN
ncbi:hypothetical protein pb186bvf_013031 [Paramecium bursaria]